MWTDLTRVGIPGPIEMMNGLRFLSVLLVALAACRGSVGGAEYHGSVGRLAAVFEIEFGDGGRVSGSYHYPDRPGVVYRLSGTNPEEGRIVLREFTGDRETARCDLQKTVTDSEIVWSGRMFNADGREFPMRLARARGGGGPAPAMPADEDEFEFEIDRTLHAENVEPVLGAPGKLEAHLYGKLYYGWIRDGALPEAETLEALIDRFRDDGATAWAAMRFAGDAVELQFENPEGRRHVLGGTNPETGRIELRDEEGKAWSGRKLVANEAIFWIVVSRHAPAKSLVIYRPRDEIYYRGYEDMKNLAPEAFLWEYNEWGDDFYERRFPFFAGEAEKATVAAVHEESGLVSSFELDLESGGREKLPLDPPRPRNRVPLAPGYPVSAFRNEGRIVFLHVGLTPISWRKREGRVLELLMFPTALVDVTFNDFGEAIYPVDQIEDLEKVAVVPDFAIIADDVYAGWNLREDKITWGIGDRGPGMLELESISLEDAPPRDERVGPWRPVAEPVDFVTNQLRIVNMSTPGGFDRVLPGNEQP